MGQRRGYWTYHERPDDPKWGWKEYVYRAVGLVAFYGILKVVTMLGRHHFVNGVWVR